MSNDNPARKPTREEIMDAIKKCAAKLDRAPKFTELQEELAVKIKVVQKLFGTYLDAVRACGLDPEGAGYPLTTEKLFLEWARVVREMGEIPTGTAFQKRSKYTTHSFRHRFSAWKNVPAGMLQYAEEKGLQDEWGDVIEITRRHFQRLATQGYTFKADPASTLRPNVVEGRPVYGEPLAGTAMAYAPTNESGVMVLFGALAMKLGFTIL